LRIRVLEIKSKIISKKLARYKRILTFAPALRMKATNKKEHVPRHIELTAVPMQIGTNKKRVRELKDLNKARIFV